MTDRRDSNDPWFANGRLTLTPDSSWLIDRQAGYKDGRYTADAFDGSMRTDPNFDSPSASGYPLTELVISSSHSARLIAAWAASTASGPGLAITHRLCELMHAGIEVHSEQGKSSSFRIELRCNTRHDNTCHED